MRSINRNKITYYINTDNWLYGGLKLSPTFSFSCTEIECKPLRKPLHGSHGCDDWHAGTVCKPKCDAGFAFFEPPSHDGYHCGDDGVWSPPDVIPDCVGELLIHFCMPTSVICLQNWSTEVFWSGVSQDASLGDILIAPTNPSRV